jgi:hypothetical protein
MQANTNYKVLVDLPLFFPPTGEEKIIFSRNGKTSKWFDFKKNFIEGRMQKAAATRIKTLIDNNTYLDNSLKNKILNNINSEEGIDDTLVINVFEDIVRRKKLNLTTQDLPAALDGVKALIDEKIIDSSSSTIQQDILLLAKNNCSPPFSETTIKNSLSYLNSLGNNDLHTADLDDCSKILSIFNHLKEKIPQHSDDAYLKKILEHIDKIIKLLSPQQERLENLANKQTYNKRVSYLKKITNNPYGWLNLKSGSSEYISSLQNFDKLSNQSKLKTKEKKELEVSLLSAQNLYPEEDILEFILFLENPSHTEEKLDSESKIKL